jgi:hypothetical protein
MVSKAPKKRRPVNDEEHRNQVWLIQWVKTQVRTFPDLECLYAIPNGGQRHRLVAAKLKAEGVRAGVFDLHLPVARGGFCGLWIELKVGKNKPTESQIEWGRLMSAQGHDTAVCYGWNEAKNKIEEYLAFQRTKLGVTE